jgi:hypothetical protein
MNFIDGPYGSEGRRAFEVMPRIGHAHHHPSERLAEIWKKACRQRESLRFRDSLKMNAILS